MFMGLKRKDAYLLVGVHAGEASAVACLAALGRELADLFLGAGEMAWLAVMPRKPPGARGSSAHRLAKLPGLVF